MTNTTGTKTGVGNGLRFLKLSAMPNGNIVALANLKSKDIVFAGKTFNSDYLYQGWLPSTGDNTLVVELNTNGGLVSSFATTDGLSKAQILSVASDNSVWMGGTYNSYYSANSLFKIGTTSKAHIGGTNEYHFFLARVTPKAIPLPVSLTTIQARLVNNTAVITWATASESNNKEFVVMRSTDGISFTAIGKLEGKGNPTQGANYEFVDKEPLFGTNYYKLQQIDFDGECNELGIKSVKFGSLVAQLKLYPNPASDKIKATFESGKYNLLSVVDASGAVVQTLTVNPLVNTLEFSLADYSNGIYTIRFSGIRENAVYKIVKQ